VDVARFAPTPQRIQRAVELRNQFKIPLGAPVALFVGRLTWDKGISELLEAFLQLEHRFSDLRLLLVGSFEDGDPLPADIRKRLEAHQRVILAGPVNDPAPYYALADVLVLRAIAKGCPQLFWKDTRRANR